MSQMGNGSDRGLTASAVVVSPPRVAAPFGLVNPLTLVDTEDDRWENGFQYETLACSARLGIRGACDPAADYEIYPGAGNDTDGGWHDYTPFMVTVERECSAVGLDWDKFREDLMDSLEFCTAKGVEREFWTGELAQAGGGGCGSNQPASNPIDPNVYLADSANTTTLNGGTAVKPLEALALLENALADCGCGGPGVIHATRGTAAILKAWRDEEYGVLRTFAGSLLIAGAGYPGTGPGGSAAGANKVWMYGTGPVQVRLGDKHFSPDTRSEAMNRKTNAVTGLADRAAAVTTDGCCIFAVLVDLSEDYS